MAFSTITSVATWAIVALATGCVIARPWKLPEAVWAALGAAGLVALALLPWKDALRAVASGTDVYLFLTGMMLLAAPLPSWLLQFSAPSLGLPTFLAGMLTGSGVLLCRRQAPWGLLREISWNVLPLVAGLFVLVEGLIRTGAIQQLSHVLRAASESSPGAATWGAGAVVAFACNLMNNLPVALVAKSAVTAASLPLRVTDALLIGVDLGPNLSVTGSLATILWLVALRREGENVSAWKFLRLGIAVMVPALIMALSGLAMVQLK